MKKIFVYLVCNMACLFAIGQTTVTTAAPTESFWDKIKFQGDMRSRIEEDFNTTQTSGNTQDNRTRLRTRARFGFTYKYNDKLELGMRIRTGNPVDQQSPHINFGTPGEFATIPIGFDKAYIKFSSNHFWFWTGKNTFPFYTNNELFWDEDVSPEGITMGYNVKASKTLEIKPVIGLYFIATAGNPFGEDEELRAAQLHLKNTTDKSLVNVAVGYFGFNDLPNVPDGAGTYAINYNDVVTSIKYTQKLKIPVSIALDLMTNLTDYSSDSVIVANNLTDEKLGYVINLEVGQLANKNNFLIGYYYSHIEKYAVVDYFAQDDWTRWNFDNATGTRSSNFSGHEIRIGYALGPKNNLVFRTYFVKGIAENFPGATIETNSRVRLDWNIGF